MTKKLTKKQDYSNNNVLSNLSIIKGFLKLHLNAKVIARSDMETLKIEHDICIDDELSSRFSDIVYN